MDQHVPLVNGYFTEVAQRLAPGVSPSAAEAMLRPAKRPRRRVPGDLFVPSARRTMCRRFLGLGEPSLRDTLSSIGQKDTT